MEATDQTTAPSNQDVEISLRELLEAGVHFGHQTTRWNPKMRPYIFGKRNMIHIIDIRETIRGLLRARKYLSQVVSGGSLILFVGTKRQAQEAVADEAGRCGQFFVSHRWLGGTLTNFVTIRASVERLNEVEKLLARGDEGLLLDPAPQLRHPQHGEGVGRPEQRQALVGAVEEPTLLEVLVGLADELVDVEVYFEDALAAVADRRGNPHGALL